MRRLTRLIWQVMSRDRWGSFQPASALLDAGRTDRRGAWSIATNTSGAPTTTDSANLAQINDGSYTLVLSQKLRGDPDANKLVYASNLTITNDLQNKQVYYIYPQQNDKTNHIKITLTANGTAVGSGDAKYFYAPCTVDEIGNLTDDTDWWTISDEEPSSLKFRIPADGVVGLSPGTLNMLGPKIATAVFPTTVSTGNGVVATTLTLHSTAPTGYTKASSGIYIPSSTDPHIVGHYIYAYIGTSLKEIVFIPDVGTSLLKDPGVGHGGYYQVNFISNLPGFSGGSVGIHTSIGNTGTQTDSGTTYKNRIVAGTLYSHNQNTGFPH